MYPELPYIAFVSAALVLVPLPWHWRARNVATLSIIAWLFIVNIIYGADAAIWGSSVKIVVPVWCDITSKLLIGSNIALAAANMCLCIHLEQISSIRQVNPTASLRRRRQIFELVMCWLVPAIWMGLHYIVQGHRFDIIEGYGCRPTTYVSIPAIFLIWVPPLLMSVIASIFAAMALVHFLQRRITFAKHLEGSQSGLTTSRYLRLMMMAIVEIIIGVASTSSTLAFSVVWDMRPWTGWANVHWDFSRIDLYAIAFMPQFVITYYYLLWWIVPISSIIFFLFFAFGQEAMKEYRACAAWLRTHILRRKSQSRPSGHFAHLPATPSSAITISNSSVQTLHVGSYDKLSSPTSEKIPDDNASQFCTRTECDETPSSYSSSIPPSHEHLFVSLESSISNQMHASEH